MNTDVLINFILDKSASMGVVTDGTIQGFNAFMEEQRKLPGARLSLTLFDTNFEVRHVAVPLDGVPALNRSTYIPSGNTALLDAVGTTIKGTEQWLIAHPGFSGKVVVAVLTDGEENSSHQWHVNHPPIPGDDKDLGGLIEWKQKEGWEFVFLGSGGSAWLEQTFGHVVAADRFYGYRHDAMATADTYSGVSRSLASSRSTGSSFKPPKQ